MVEHSAHMHAGRVVGAVKEEMVMDHRDETDYDEIKAVERGMAQEKLEEIAADNGFCRSFTGERLADDLEKLALNVRWCSAEERAGRLVEAARRLKAPRIHQILVTLPDGSQVGIFLGGTELSANVMLRRTPGSMWDPSLPKAQGNPHTAGTYHIGEW